MLVTVAICTRNRAASLDRALASLTRCAVGHDVEWEVVVVDNASSDDTTSVIARYERVLPVRRVVEKTPGLSRARNAAVRAARGAYVLWTDDDCVVDPRWIEEYTSAFRKSPDTAVFGGPIRPTFDDGPPAWLARIADYVGSAYAARDLGPSIVPLAADGDRLPFGANYAIRAHEQRAHRYEEHLGRGSSLTSLGEESVLMERLLASGASGQWIPGASVTHHIPPDRQTVEYLRRHYEAYGAFLEWRGSGETPPASSAKLRTRVVTGELRFRLLRGLNWPERWIGGLVSASVAGGRLRARRENQ